MTNSDGAREQSRVNALAILLAVGGFIGLINPVTILGAASARIFVSFASGLILLALIPFLYRTRSVGTTVVCGTVTCILCFFSGFLSTGELYHATLAVSLPIVVAVFAKVRYAVATLFTISVALIGGAVAIHWGYWIPPMTPESYGVGIVMESTLIVLVMSAVAGGVIWKERLVSLAVESESQALAEANLQQRRFEVACKSTYDAIFEADDNGRITWASGKLVEQLGYNRQDIIGKHQLSFVPANARREIVYGQAKAEKDNHEFFFETKLLDRQGQTHWVRISGGRFSSPDGSTGWVTAVSDIGDEMIHTGRLLERSRLESLGTVCGGLAHDFNNLLTVIGIYGELVAEDEVRDAIMQAQRQASDVTAGLLTFARKQEFRDQNVDVGDFLVSFKPIIERLLPASISCTWDIQCFDESVLIDPSQLQQVLINLVTNAEQAMGSVGELRISVGTRDIDQSEADLHAIQPGSYVTIDVVDSGSGMAPETAARAMEPFFTTKPRGEGTGLGLATVHGVACRAGGTVIVTTEIGVGTEISVVLPTHSTEFADPALNTQNCESAYEVDGKGQRILLIDDRDSLTQAVAKVLISSGYDVETCFDAEQAWTKYVKEPPFDLVVTDIVLPGMSGIKFVRNARLTNKNLKAILISGHQQGDLSVVSKFSDITRFIPKPFKSSDLLHAVSEMLSAEEPVAS